MLLEKQFQGRWIGGDLKEKKKQRENIEDMVSWIVLSGYHWIINKQDLKDLFMKFPPSHQNDPHPHKGEKEESDVKKVHEKGEENSPSLWDHFYPEGMGLFPDERKEIIDDFLLWIDSDSLQPHRPPHHPRHKNNPRLTFHDNHHQDQQGPRLLGIHHIDLHHHQQHDPSLPYVSFHLFQQWFSHRMELWLKNRSLQTIENNNYTNSN